MKKSILVLAIAAIGMVSFTSCSNDNGNESATEGQAEKEYYCPMKCEGDKMYAEEGSCPVCKMDLVKD